MIPIFHFSLVLTLAALGAVVQTPASAQAVESHPVDSDLNQTENRHGNEDRVRMGEAEVRYVRHFLDGDSGDGRGKYALLLLDASSALPERIQSEVWMMQEVEEVMEKISTYQVDEMHLRLRFPRPGWRIIIPIR